jgi:hypothetical protein
MFYLYLFTYTGVQHDFHIRWCSCRLTVTWRVLHVKQELLTTPEHLSSPPVYSELCIAWSLVFCAMFCRSLFVFLSFYFWPLYCLSFFDLRLLITPLVSSNLLYCQMVTVVWNTMSWLLWRFNATSYNILVISWWSDYWWMKPGEKPSTCLPSFFIT